MVGCIHRWWLGTNVFHTPGWWEQRVQTPPRFEGSGIAASDVGELFSPTGGQAVFLDGALVQRVPPYLFGLQAVGFSATWLSGA